MQTRGASGGSENWRLSRGEHGVPRVFFCCLFFGFFFGDKIDITKFAILTILSVGFSGINVAQPPPLSISRVFSSCQTDLYPSENNSPFVH